MNVPRTAGVLAAAGVLLLAAGCYETTDITWYEAGVYKGAADPLRDKLSEGDLPRQLAERFRSVQTDR